MSARSAADIQAIIVASDLDGGCIADNIAMFARLLRAAGLPAGPDKTALATQAVLAVGLDDPKRFYWALHAVFVGRRAEHDLFNQAFVMFWRDPGFLDQLMSLMLPTARSGRPTTRRSRGAWPRRCSPAAGAKPRVRRNKSSCAPPARGATARNFSKKTSSR